MFELVERLIGMEMAVKDTDVKVSELTHADSAIIEKLINNVQLLQDEVSSNRMKIVALELKLSYSLDQIGALEMALTKAREEFVFAGVQTLDLNSNHWVS